jgi:hypothetical protein
MALAPVVTGCGFGGSGEEGVESSAGATTTLGAAVTERDSTEFVLAPGEGLAEAKRNLALILGVATAGMRLSASAPAAPGADAVIEWETGSAEVDSMAGRVYLVSANQAQVDPRQLYMTEPRLTVAARRMPAALGWEDGMLAALGFKQEQPGALSSVTGLFCLTWSRYGAEGALEDGFVEVYVDGRAGSLVSFSLSLGSEGPDVAGALGAKDAVDIAETYIYLKTKDPDIPMAGDGSLILLQKSVAQELKVVEDRKITRGEPLLTWVISLTGAVEGKTVGGTVYINAMTGEVLYYEASSDE